MVHYVDPRIGYCIHCKIQKSSADFSRLFTSGFYSMDQETHCALGICDECQGEAESPKITK